MGGDFRLQLATIKNQSGFDRDVRMKKMPKILEDACLRLNTWPVLLPEPPNKRKKEHRHHQPQKEWTLCSHFAFILSDQRTTS